jgi:mannonate dehydratase
VLPNSQNVDFANPICQPYWEKMKELGLVLLAHTGDEHAVDAGGLDQELGNPLKLLAPLLAGVRVIAAHCASDGVGRDWIQEDALNMRPIWRNNVDLLLDLMSDSRFEKLLFADVSAMSGRRRMKSLHTILSRTDIHSRLIYGSDYPIPAVGIIVSTGGLVSEGLITEEERMFLDEIRAYNALLFSFAVIRLVCSGGNRFPSSMFTRPEILN